MLSHSPYSWVTTQQIFLTLTSRRKRQTPVTHFLWKAHLTFFFTSDNISQWKAYFPYERINVLKNRLEEIRKLRGIKQDDLATALEVSRQTIGSLENGRYNPSIILAFKIARYFSMTIEEIFIYEEETK